MYDEAPAQEYPEAVENEEEEAYKRRAKEWAADPHTGHLREAAEMELASIHMNLLGACRQSSDAQVRSLCSRFDVMSAMVQTFRGEK